MQEYGDSHGRYTRVAILLHWSIAILILGNLAVGFVMEGLTGPLRSTVISAHISSGMTVLALTVVRVLWRLTHEPPPYPASMKPWERHAASLAHFALYSVMVLMPLSGWALISANPPVGSAGAAAVAAARAAASPVAAGGGNESRRQARRGPRTVWGVVPLPEIRALERIGATPEGVPLQKALHDDLVETHAAGAFLTIALLLLHIGGALKHQLIDGHAEMARMGAGRSRPRTPGQ